MRKKVFVVTTNIVDDYCDHSNVPRVFESRKAAEAELQIVRRGAIADYEDYEIPYEIDPDTPNIFEIYRDDSWAKDHFRVEIHEVEIE